MTLGRPRTFDRDEALDRMINVFWQHGYDASSVAMLTEACGLGAPSLYNAFGDKRTLFLEALDRYLMTYAAFTSSALEEKQAYTAIAHLLREAAAAYTRPDKPAGCLLITATTNCGPQSSDVADRLRARRTEGRRALTAKLQTALDAGELPPDTDPSALAGFYAATLQGMSAQARDGASRDDLLKIAAAALRAWPGTHVASAESQIMSIP